MRRHALFWCGRADPADPLKPNDFAASVRDLELSVRAARALGVADEDMHAFVCRDDLLPEEFGPSKHPATLLGLERALAAIARSASPDDALLFVATNHGERRGLLTVAEVDEFADDDGPRLLTPETLERCLNVVPGHQVLVLATCHAGIFLPLGQRPNRVVLAACAEDQSYYVEEDPPCSALLIELFRAWCSTELPDRQTSSSSNIVDLDTAFTRAEQRLASEYQTLKPLRQGAAVWPLRR